MKAKLDIETGLRNGTSQLKQYYATPPFKIANLTEGRKEKLRLMIMSSSPGILDGDEYSIQIRIGQGSSLQLETQAYQRVFQMNSGAAQCIEVNMEKDSFFSYLPHPLVPHKGSCFTAKNKLYLSGGCTLCWGEIHTSGRKLNGESFLFSKLQNLTEIYLDQKLVVRENLLLMPGMLDIHGLGQMEGFSDQASLIFLKNDFPIPPAIEKINQILADYDEIEFGCTSLPINGLLVRIVGNRAEQLFDCFQLLASYLQDLAVKNFVYAK